MMPTGRKMMRQKRRWMGTPSEKPGLDGKDKTGGKRRDIDGKGENGRER